MYARGEQYYVSAMRNTMGFTKFPAIHTSIVWKRAIGFG
ncbi:hypothetical protein BN000_01086 [Mycobacterium europaeum]|uniref:Uncharacterized protein n=1 Tax=Mycobacterium europaeum TaxID=761804 RepID=A0A0U1D064_9MYCO|nr:hypothetical protein BN000_01086 [Mycobacterium europaeum]